MRQNNLSVHSENILPIIKKWLYSEKEIFVRELISNASDAITKRKEVDPSLEEIRIDVVIDKKEKTITISDTGIGMTEEEVERYIAQIAFSGAEEFAKKYEKAKDSIIGHFGLGFYSSYMVAEKVEIETLSFQKEAKAVFWSCDGSSSYLIGEGSKEKVGTSIILHISSENEEYLEEHRLRSLLDRFCKFMPYPIFLNGSSIGNKEPLWLKNPSDCKEEEYKECYQILFPMEKEPLFWVHLNVDYPFHLKGILFFPKQNRRFDQEQKSIHLFCNKVFVSDQCQEILPDYLMVLKGALDSKDLPLNVSRSYLQIDPTVKQLSSHIGKKIADRLTLLLRNEKDRYIESFQEIEPFLKLGILQDAKFYERVKELLLWKNSQDEWTTLEEYLERAKEKKIYYTTSHHKDFLVEILKEKGIEVIFANSSIDTAVIQFLEEKLEATFQRVDGSLPQDLLDPTKEDSSTDETGKNKATKIAEFIQKSLENHKLSVEAKSLSSEKLPAIVVIDENQRRLRDYLALTQGKAVAEKMEPKKSFIVNTNHPLIESIHQLSSKEPETADQMIQSLYQLSLLRQKEVKPEDLDQFLLHQTSILEKFASLLV